MKPCSTIFFDFGGVLTKDPQPFRFLVGALAQKHRCEYDELLETLVYHWNMARVDTKKDDLFWKAVAKVAGITPTQLKKDVRTFTTINAGVIDLLPKIRKTHRTAVLSNHIFGWLDWLLHHHRLTPLFDEIITSYEAGFAKPDPRIFAYAVQKLKVPKHECVFIDDNQRHVEAANKFGLTALQYHNQKQLKKDLKKLKIL